MGAKWTEERKREASERAAQRRREAEEAEAAARAEQEETARRQREERQQRLLALAPQRELPGEPVSADEALAKFRTAHYAGAEPSEYFRWRLQLSCGHVTEAVTSGEDDLPLGSRMDYRVGGSGKYPEGHAPCEECQADWPWRDIAEWKHRTVHDNPADPVEPPERYRDDPEAWAEARHAEPWQSVIWSVILSCGHQMFSYSTDLDWKPEDGITYGIDPDDEKAMARRAEILADPDWPEDLKRQYELMLPEPTPGKECMFCARDRVITAYQPAGWLADPPGWNWNVAYKRRAAEFRHDHPEVELTYRGAQYSGSWTALAGSEVIATGDGLGGLLQQLAELFGPTQAEQARQRKAHRVSLQRELERAELDADRLRRELTRQRRAVRQLRKELAAPDED